LDGQIRLRMLGPVELQDGDGALRSGGPQLRLLLALLALSPGHVVPVSDLIDAIWDERPPPSARASLQILVTRLRRLLAGVPGCAVDRCGDGYRLQLGPQLVDVHRFRSLVGSARQARDDDEAITVLGQALRLWRGPALADVAATARVDAIRAGLAEEHLSAAQDRFGRLLAAERDAEAAAEIPIMLAGHPLAERLAGLLMIAWYRCGRPADALQVFRDLRGRLVGELAVEPGAELQRLHQQILRGDPVLVTGDQLRSGDGGRQAGTAGHREARAGPVPVTPGNGQAMNVLVVPRQLPAGPAGFAGRQQELRTLTGRLDAGPGGGPMIVTLGGAPGVGKTALALHWAHQVQQRFPDGQLYVNLRGFDASPDPVTPAEAISGFLESMGVGATQVSPRLDARSAVYRSLLAGRRLLVVLDNARDEAQVRPLLPGSATCLVVVTSRSELTGLVAAEGACPVRLDVLTEPEARQLLASRIGAGRVAAEAAAVAEVITQCARLPLALAIAAARAATRPALPLAALADELRDVRGRLDGLSVGDDATSLKAVFSWSCRLLSEPAERMFRLLGAHSGPDISAAAAASLAAVSTRSAHALLAELVRASLVQEQAAGRFTMHDLVRAYAAGLGDQAESRAAIRRALDYYLRSARAAVGLVYPAAARGTNPAPGHDAPPERFADPDQALDWLQAEHQVLLAACAAAADGGFDDHALLLPAVLGRYLARREHYLDWARSQRQALAAARRLGDDAAGAVAHRSLGEALIQLGSWEEARRQLLDALTLYRRLGDSAGQASCQCGLGRLCESQGDHARALHHARHALRLYRAVGDLAGQAAALNGIGWHNALLGDNQRALGYCERALELHRANGDRFGEAVTLDSLGYCHHRDGRHSQAVTFYQHALDAYADIGERYYRAHTLIRLGETRQASGNPQAAQDNWEQAAQLLDDLRHPDAEAVRARLCDVARVTASDPMSSAAISG
jgi:DNA-binding SARP family transcriptional activator/tetratricopeptide (TPR) repeat protein